MFPRQRYRKISKMLVSRADIPILVDGEESPACGLPLVRGHRRSNSKCTPVLFVIQIPPSSPAAMLPGYYLTSPYLDRYLVASSLHRSLPKVPEGVRLFPNQIIYVRQYTYGSLDPY